MRCLKKKPGLISDVDCIVQVDATDTTRGVWRVIVILKVTKGNPAWNHPVCLERFPNRQHPLDVVYYLNRYSLSVTQKSLVEITKRSERQNAFDSSPVWPLQRDAMRERIKRRLAECGFPPALWSFHSLRSDHICSAQLIPKTFTAYSLGCLTSQYESI